MSNSDQGDKKAGVPSWQLQAKPTESKETEEPASESPSRESVIEQAKKFLQEDEVRNESTDKKIAFLEGKGLKSEEITELLGVSRNQEASAPPEVSSCPYLYLTAKLLTFIADLTTLSQTTFTTPICFPTSPRHTSNNNLP